MSRSTLRHPVSIFMLLSVPYCMVGLWVIASFGSVVALFLLAYWFLLFFLAESVGLEYDKKMGSGNLS